MFNPKLTEKQITQCIVVISLFFGLLAFTQKSLAAEDTDCIRYYAGLEYFENINPLEVFGEFDFMELINFVFYPVSAFTVALTGNVQSISFLWTFLVYFLTFLSARRLLKYYECYSNRRFAYLLICLTLCFIAFVQVSELLKQASAFAVFFYGFTMFMTGGSKSIGTLCIFAAIGLHPTSMMLLVLFFYNKVDAWLLLAILLIVIGMSMFVDVVTYSMSLLPASNYTRLLMERFSVYEQPSGSIHYMLLQFLMLFPSLFIWLIHKPNDRKQQYAINVVLLYFLVSCLNFGNLVAYLRFSIFAHWLFALDYILCLKNIRYNDVRIVLRVLVFSMSLMTMRWTVGRTTEGGYASSYMDNNIMKIITSSSYDFLIVDYKTK